MIEDGEVLVLGGLIREQVTEVQSVFRYWAIFPSLGVCLAMTTRRLIKPT